jgi:hypothetical protein
MESDSDSDIDIDSDSDSDSRTSEEKYDAALSQLLTIKSFKEPVSERLQIAYETLANLVHKYPDLANRRRWFQLLEFIDTREKDEHDEEKNGVSVVQWTRHHVYLWDLMYEFARTHVFMDMINELRIYALQDFPNENNIYDNGPFENFDIYALFWNILGRIHDLDDLKISGNPHMDDWFEPERVRARLHLNTHKKPLDKYILLGFDYGIPSDGESKGPDDVLTALTAGAFVRALGAT